MQCGCQWTSPALSFSFFLYPCQQIVKKYHEYCQLRLNKICMNSKVVFVGTESTLAVGCITSIHVLLSSVRFSSQGLIFPWNTLTTLILFWCNVQACREHELVGCSTDGETVQGIQEAGGVCACIDCLCQLWAAVHWRNDLSATSWASETHRRNGVSALCFVVSRGDF